MYNGSDQHKQNALKARELAVEANKINKQHRIEMYKNTPTLCTFCLSALPYNKRNNKFCGSSCAASFNNTGRVRTEESKNKVKDVYYSKPEHAEHLRIKIMCPEIKIRTTAPRVCKICNSEYYNATLRYCSPACSKQAVSMFRSDPEYRKAVSDRQKKLYAEGKIKGWSTRSKLKPSYPEQYFINLFNNENIEYEREVKKGRFFCDFVWEDKKLILEVDGKQHTYPDHIERDKRKDTYLQSIGYTVVRIQWVNPTTDVNKEKLYEQINNFKQVLQGVAQRSERLAWNERA